NAAGAVVVSAATASQSAASLVIVILGLVMFRSRDTDPTRFGERRNIRHPTCVSDALQPTVRSLETMPMKRQVIPVEPISTWLERWKAPTSVVTRHGDTIYVSGLPPFDPKTGEVIDAPIERQTELVLDQLKLCIETAGSSLENVLKCNVYCTSVDKVAVVTAIYARYF